MLSFDAWKESGRRFGLYYYEVSDGEDTLQFAPTEFVDISETEAVKRAACYAHASQSPERFYDCRMRLRGSGESRAGIRGPRRLSGRARARWICLRWRRSGRDEVGLDSRYSGTTMMRRRGNWMDRGVLAACMGAALTTLGPATEGGAKKVIPYLDEQPVRARHGMVVALHHLAADAGLRGVARGRECGGCGGGDGVCAGGGASDCGEPGRRGISAAADEGGTERRLLISGRRRRWRLRRRCTGREGRGDSGCERARVQGDCDAGVGGGAGVCGAQVRKAGAEAGDGAGDQAGGGGVQLTEEEAQRAEATRTWRSTRTASGSFSGTGIFIRRAKRSASRSWRER